ncbi:unnamed protein product [Soboliphyme baturini]|uniref:TLC domain-containing protein n=1 Tax=Soboliphyme baturini TaxID=241478 RepID=A0A183IAA8_9BILA|nr:unnamed protein product [Soboliphyme baturini]
MDLNDKFRCCCNCVHVTTGTFILAEVWFCICIADFVLNYIYSTEYVALVFVALVLNGFFELLMIIGIYKTLPKLVLSYFVFLNFLYGFFLCLIAREVTTLVLALKTSHRNGLMASVIFMATCGIELAYAVWMNVIIFKCYKYLKYRKTNILNSIVKRRLSTVRKLRWPAQLYTGDVLPFHLRCHSTSYPGPQISTIEDIRGKNLRKNKIKPVHKRLEGSQLPPYASASAFGQWVHSNSKKNRSGRTYSEP